MYNHILLAVSTRYGIYSYKEHTYLIYSEQMQDNKFLFKIQNFRLRPDKSVLRWTKAFASFGSHSMVIGSLRSRHSIVIR